MSNAVDEEFVVKLLLNGVTVLPLRSLNPAAFIVYVWLVARFEDGVNVIVTPSDRAAGVQSRRAAESVAVMRSRRTYLAS